MLSFSGFSYQRQQERDRKEIKHMKNRLHVKAPGNWVNDPNGMIYYKGQYHLFYQHFPYAPRWGTMHWGHAVSPDLIHWEHVGVALFPSLSEDQNGCFSGSAVEENGVMHLFYTGVHYNQVNPKDIHQCLDQDFTSAQLHLTETFRLQSILSHLHTMCIDFSSMLKHNLPASVGSFLQSRSAFPLHLS